MAARRITFGENKVEVSDSEYKAAKKLTSKIEREAEPDVNSGYVHFQQPEDSPVYEEPISAMSSKMDLYANLIYKSLDNICDGVKKMTLHYEEEPRNMFTKDAEIYKSQDGDVPLTQNESEEPIYLEIQETRSPQNNETTEQIEKMVEVAIEYVKCQYIKDISGRSRKVMKEIFETKTRLQSYRSKVDQLEKQTKSAASSLNSLCAQLEKGTKRTSKVATRLNKFFSRGREPDPRNMSDQIETIADHIETVQKIQNAQETALKKQNDENAALQKKLREAQEEIRDLRGKFAKRKSTWFDPRVLRSDVSIQVTEEAFGKREECAVGDFNKSWEWLKLDTRGPLELKTQLEEIKLQISGILKGIENANAGADLEDELNEEICSMREALIKTTRKIMGDKQEVVD